MKNSTSIQAQQQKAPFRTFELCSRSETFFILHEILSSGKIFQDVFNFTYTIQKPGDGEWGVEQADGQWSGMVGMLSRKEIDIGISSKHTLCLHNFWTLHYGSIDYLMYRPLHSCHNQ